MRLFNHINISTLLVMLMVWSFIFSSCKRSSFRDEINRMNREAYSVRYKNLDSLNLYSTEAYNAALKHNYKYGITDALCNRAFYLIARMHYAKADSVLHQAQETSTDNISRLSTEILFMRLCQRRSQNKEFYVHQFRAERLINHIHNNISTLDDDQRFRYIHLRSEYGIILSAYLYYVGHTDASLEALHAIHDDEDIALPRDTAQWLSYLYNMGDGGVNDQPTEVATKTKEFDYLMQCYMIASHSGYTYWEANALQALSEHILNPSDLYIMQANDDASLRYLNNDQVPDSLLPLTLSQHALELFIRYGDVYQTAAAWRTLAENYMQLGDYDAMVNCLHSALRDTLLRQSPNIMASLDEKLSVAYAAINDKMMSDSCRNLYLDLQDSTRQDRQLEARADGMRNTVVRLQVEVVILFSLLLIMLIILYFLMRRRRSEKYRQHTVKLDDRIEELHDELSMCELTISDSKRLNIEQHAKLSLVQNILPIIDRMVYAVNHSKTEDSMEYVSELCDDIQRSNELLTKWVQLRKGDIKLKVESFPLQQLFDIVRLGNISFQKAGITLIVPQTDIVLKADKALTLFLINTLLDNARKYTLSGGTVEIQVVKCDDGYADISVKDNGQGMSDEKAYHLFEYQSVDNIHSEIDNNDENLKEQKSHGFGLVNCRGIINRYKKTSSLFSNADIKAVSRVGKGTTITFRLPYILKLLILVLGLSFMTTATEAASYSNNPYFIKASAECDTVYMCNVEGLYGLSLCYADSCLKYINLYYRSIRPNSKDTLVAMSGKAELGWFRRKVPMDYDLILSLRNEVAVASLALHEWDIYSANNSIYTSLYRECSADLTLSDYCEDMERYETINDLVLALLVALIASIVFIIYKFYFLDIKKRRERLTTEIEQLEQDLQVLRSERDRLYVSNSIIDNTLSTIKHETMYYPARISSLIDAGSESEIKELVNFYRSLYSILSSQCMRLSSEKAYQPSVFSVGELAGLISKYADVSSIETLKDSRLLGNKELVAYLFLLLKRKNKGAVVISTYEISDDRRYVRLTVDCPEIHLLSSQTQNVFMSNTHDVDYLIMKQIMREIGSMSNRYGSGISVGTVGTTTSFIITLPLTA